MKGSDKNHINNFQMAEDEGSSPESEDILLVEAKLAAILSCKTSEDQMDSILKKLPSNVINCLPEGVLYLLQTKMNYTPIGISWLKAILRNYGKLFEEEAKQSILQQIFKRIEEALRLQSPLNELKGKLDLLIYQMDNASDTVGDETPRLTLSENWIDSDENTTDFVLQSSGNDKNLVWNGDNSEEEYEDAEEEIELDGEISVTQDVTSVNSNKKT